MKIQAIDVITLTGTATEPNMGIGQWQCQPLHQYPEFLPSHEPRPSPAGRRLEGIFVEITGETGIVGRYGPLYRMQGQLIRDQLGPFLMGRDAFAIEILHDQMLRLDRHGRNGTFMTAISALDCALWDLKGKALGQPVYRLLGGPSRDRLPVYASMLGFSVDPETAAATAVGMKNEGYPAQKWFFAHGPGEGDAGLRRNLDLAFALREAVGSEYPLMFDAFMGWDLPYASRMLSGLEDIRPAWMEEPVPPEQFEAFRRLKQAHPSIPLATGEHVYGRWQTSELLATRSVDVLQNDPDWTGGITEQLHICSLASAATVPVIAHGHSVLPALHVAAARPPATVPYVEFLLSFQKEKQHFQSQRLWPENGSLPLPEGSGLGIDLDEARIESRSQFTG